MDRLYEHDGAALLPLLERYFPYSLAVYGAIISNIERARKTDESVVNPYSTLAPGTQANLPRTELFVVVIPLPAPQQFQLRLFSSYEAEANITPEGLASAKKQICEAVKAYRALNPDTTLLGAVHSMWEETLRKEIFNCKARGMCGAWIPPPGQGDQWRRMADEAGPSKSASGQAGSSWAVDQGRDVDVDHFQATSDIKRSYDYYESRLTHSTVIRPAIGHSSDETGNETQPAAAILLTHSDGSLGALHTQADHRRKGLARWVVLEHLASGRAILRPPPSADPALTAFAPADDTARAWAVVFKTNEASNALWQRLGWRCAWDLAWIYPDERETAEVIKLRTQLEGLLPAKAAASA